MATIFEFIPTDPTTTLKPGKSSAIRSRCMLGKNKREGSRRSIREKKKKELAEIQSIVRIESTIPPSLNELSAIQFPARVDSEARALIFKAFNYETSGPDLSPLDRYVDYDWSESISFQWVFTDATFLHLMLYASYAFNDLALPTSSRPPSRKSEFHLRETLVLLAKKLDDAKAADDEVILSVVIYLGLLATLYGDWKSASAHFAGLKTIIQLRGGIEYLRKRPSLLFKLNRLDLAWSMGSGRSPYFLYPPESMSTVLSPRRALSGLYQPPATWDPRLAAIFLDLQQLSTTINTYVRKNDHYNALYYQSILSSIQSRLMYFADTFIDPLQQLVRLALLAFLTTTFRMPQRNLPYPWLSTELEKAYMRAGRELQADETLSLWVVVVIAISVKGTEEPWVQEALLEEDDELSESWFKVKNQLEKVMWIECIHDEPGMHAWRRLSLRRSRGQDLIVPMVAISGEEEKVFKTPRGLAACAIENRYWIVAL